MSPDRAWFVQARSDLRSAQFLEACGADTCQIVMHLQMAGEKLIKGYVRRSGPVLRTHAAVHGHFAHLKGVVVASPKLGAALMGRSANRDEVNAAMRALKRTMRRVELFNPSVAARNSPNCEYPWESAGPPVLGHPPARHRFGPGVGKAARAKLYRLLDRILTAEGA